MNEMEQLARDVAESIYQDAERYRALTDWQPIETAPKDHRILVFNPFFGVYSSQYTEEADHDWRGYPLGLSDIGFGRWYCVPTHWMPLPPPPAARVCSDNQTDGA